MKRTGYLPKTTGLLLSIGIAIAMISLWFTSPIAAAPATPHTPDTYTLAAPNALECPICTFDMSTYNGPLSATEINGLLLALNDEYHAWAVYNQVIQDFGAVLPFTRIQQAERMHINALIRQFNLYNVPIPTNPWIGNVASFGSVQEACAAGVDAEINNIALYDTLFSSTQQQSIVQVYSALQHGSTMHQRAFENCSTGSSCMANQGSRQGNRRGMGRGGW